MTMTALKAQVDIIINAAGVSAEFYFLMDNDQIKLTNIENSAQSELANIFIGSIGQMLSDTDLSLLNISAADERRNVIYKYDLDDIPHELEAMKSIIDSDQFPQYDFSTDDLSNVKAILIVIGNHTGQLAIYKKQYPVSLLRKNSSFTITRIGNGNRFEKLGSDVLKINQNFEFMFIDNNYYIVDIGVLEKFFGFHEAVKKSAQTGVETIRTADLVVDADALMSSISNVAFARKLIKATRGSPVLGKIPNDEIINFIRSHPKLKKLKLSHDGKKLDLKTKVSQVLFLKLLNDDFLHSELTKKFYESLAKDNIDEGAAATDNA